VTELLPEPKGNLGMRFMADWTSI